MKVADILRVKGTALYTVTPDAPLQDAVNLMAELDIGSAVVMQFGELVGMLTFREVINRLHQNGGSIGDVSTGRLVEWCLVDAHDSPSAARRELGIRFSAHLAG